MQQPKHAAQTQPTATKAVLENSSQPLKFAPSAKSVNKAIKPITLAQEPQSLPQHHPVSFNHGPQLSVMPMALPDNNSDRTMIAPPKIEPPTLSSQPSINQLAVNKDGHYRATDSVNSNVNQLVDQNSHLMQKIKAQAIEQKRSMGLQNSTLAISAAQDAGLNHALSIARDDANIQNQKNLQSNQFKQDDKNKAWQSNENLLNRQHDESQLNKQQTWQSNENTLSRNHQNELEQLKHKNSLGLLDAQQKARLEELEKQQAWQSSENALSREHDQSQLDKQQTWQSGENALAREHDVSQLDKQQAWQSGENALSREHQSELQALQREHELGMLDIQGQQRMAELEMQAQIQASENQAQRDWQSSEAEKDRLFNDLRDEKNRGHEMTKQRDLIDAEFKKLGKELDANNKENYLKQSVQLRSSYDAIIQSIYSNPELKPEEQRAAIEREYQRYRTALEDLYLSYQTLTGMNEQPVTGDNDAPNTSLPKLDNVGPQGPNTNIVSDSEKYNAQYSQGYATGQPPPTHGINPPQQSFISVPGQPQQGDKQRYGIKLPGKHDDEAIGGFVDYGYKRATR